MKTARTESEAYQRILATASDLFYRNGYRATGINEIIEKSGVAKATFYAHFPSKDALALAYVRAMNEVEVRGVEAGIKMHRGPYEKLIGLLQYLVPWSEKRDYRGCGYLNISSEVTDDAHPVRQESRNHYELIRTLVGDLMRDLKAARGKAWKDRDPARLTDEYLLLFAGGLSLAQVYHDSKPLHDAVSSAKRLLA